MNRTKNLIFALFIIMLSSVPVSGATAAILSLEEKVGQIMMCSFEGPSLSPSLRKLVEDLKIGGVVLYSSWGNIASTAQVKELCDEMQTLARSSGAPPLFVAIDQEGGIVSRIREGVSQFPGNMALGAAGDEILAAEAASDCARELSVLGINMNFAPVADVNNNPLNPVIGVRSFGSSPELVSEFAVAMATASLKEGVIPVGKHFPGHGNAAADSHRDLPAISSDKESLGKIELAPFRALIKSGIPAIMTAHILVSALDRDRPATLSPVVISLLREEMGFGGVVISDSLGMGALKGYGSVAEVAVEAFRSGVDILLFGADSGFSEQEQFGIYEKILEACRNGTIPIKRLDEAVSRILTLKRGLSKGSAKKTNPSLFKEAPSVSKISSKSVTLVRRWREASEMIKKGAPIPLLWPANHAEAGKRLAEACPFFTLTILPQKPNRGEIFRTAEMFEANPVIFAGEYDCWKEKEWLSLLKKLGEKRLFILSARTPYSLLSLPDSGGFFALYSDGRASLDALANILNGRARPKGKLPVEIPGHCPMGWGEEEF